MRQVPFSPSRLGIIASNTLCEAVRQRLFLFLLVVAVGLVASVQFLREFNFGTSELKFVIDFGLGALVSFGSILTIAATAQLFFSEMEHRTALTLLAKPVGRAEFMLGKFLGVWAVVGLFCLTTTILLAALLFSSEVSLRAADPDRLAGVPLVNYGGLVVVAALQWLKFGVLAMMTLLIASFSNTNLFTVAVSFFVLVICHLQYLAREFYGEEGGVALRVLAGLLGAIFPNFQVFNVAEAMALTGGEAAGLPVYVLLRVAWYGAGYLAVFGGLAIYSFRKREI